MILRNGWMVALKYCFTCGIIRPFWASHCWDCDACIEVLDHHCSWLGTCIGRRNYTFFILFIMSFWLQVFISSALNILEIVWFYRNPLVLPFHIIHLVFFSPCILTFLFLLLFLHGKLFFQGKTTNEQIKKHPIRSGNRAKFSLASSNRSEFERKTPLAIHTES